MNNQPLPKPTPVIKADDSHKNDVGATPPPSALNKNPGITSSSPATSTTSTAPMTSQSLSDLSSNPGDVSTQDKLAAGSNKQGVVFDSNNANSRIPLAQKLPSDSLPDLDKSTKPTQKNEEIALPPTSLSALSSMSSTTIPNGSNTNKVIMPEKTVLGRPIPQTIRGEKMPKGLSANSSESVPGGVGSNPAGFAPSRSSVPSPRMVQSKTSPVPTSQNTEINTGGGDSSINKKKPMFATENKSMFKFLPFIVGGITLLAVIVFVASKFLGGSGATPLPAQQANTANNNVVQNNPNADTGKRTEVPAEQKEILYWGLWEPNEVFDEIISSFEAENPGVKVTYVKQSHKDYRERLQTALDRGTGPDVFRFHASWSPMLKSNLSPIPSNIISPKEFKDNYYPIVTDQLVVGGQYVGVPLMYDGLALYYNEDILNSANETPPTTWAELRLLASKLTVKSASGIQRAGLAIGNTSNVDHFSDILAVLMLQNGADFNNPNSQETQDALLFYTNFVTKDGVWDDKLPSSTVAFARGDVAMMFAPSWRAHEIAAQNPDLKFKTTTLPQLSDERISWGSYWAEGINSLSKNKDIAAKFVSYLSSDENLSKLFSTASEIRSFGEIYPKASMAEKLINNEIVSPYLDDAPYAKGWYMSSFTHDNGINDQMIQYYKDAINALIKGEKIDDILTTLESGTREVLQRYGISSK